MKQKLAAFVRIVVSVGILAYLFNSIFQKEALQYFDAHNIDPDALNWMERARIVWSVGPQSLWHELQKINAVWLLASVACMGVTFVLGVIRWRWVLRVQGLELRFWRAFSISFIGQFFNAFMLGSTGGDVIKAWYVAHETHHKKAEAVTTVVVDRLIGLLALFLIALVMMVAYYHRVFDDVKMRWFAVFTLVVVLVTVAGTIIGFWRGFGDRFPRVRDLLVKLPRYDMLRRMLEAYRAYASHPVVLVKTMVISFAVHIASMLSIVCIGYGLGIHSVSMTDYFLYLPMINSVTAVPISISGFGVREGMYAVMFGAVGVGAQAAVAMSLLGYLANLFWSIVGGGFFLTHRKEIPSPQTIAIEE